VACAFEHYYAGRWQLVIPQVLSACRHHPSWLKDKGVVSIFIKSLSALLSRRALANGR
jgi:hypothetical protein